MILLEALIVEALVFVVTGRLTMSSADTHRQLYVVENMQVVYTNIYIYIYAYILLRLGMCRQAVGMCRQAVRCVRCVSDNLR